MGILDEINKTGLDIETIKNIISYGSEEYGVYQGIEFEVTDLSTGLADGGKKYYLIDPVGLPDTERFGLRGILISSSGDLVVRFYQNPTVSANGTALTVYNKNDYSSTTSKSAVYSDPTVTSTGSEKIVYYHPGAKDVGYTAEQFFKNNVLDGLHLIEIENVSGTTLDYLNIGLTWREYITQG